MIYILSTIIGTLLTAIALYGTYEFVEYDLFIMIWIAVYTFGIYVTMYGVNNTKERFYITRRKP